jgi:L-fuconolactonase
MRRELDFLTDDDRTRVLGGTAAALLRWPEQRGSAIAKHTTPNEAH